MVFVPHRLAYFTQHNALQFHPCCCKGYKLHSHHFKKGMVKLDGFQDFSRFLRFHVVKFRVLGFRVLCVTASVGRDSSEHRVCLTHQPVRPHNTEQVEWHHPLPPKAKDYIYLSVCLIFRSQFKWHFSGEGFCDHPTHVVLRLSFFKLLKHLVCLFCLFSICLC